MVLSILGMIAFKIALLSSKQGLVLTSIKNTC